MDDCWKSSPLYLFTHSFSPQGFTGHALFTAHQTEPSLCDDCLFFQVVQDWKFVAQVLDRIFLWAFLTASILGTVLIFTPALQKFLSSPPPVLMREEPPSN